MGRNAETRVAHESRARFCVCVRVEASALQLVLGYVA